MIDAQAQPSYTNNNYKSKDTNININKIKCINDNININGINSGDVNAAGNKGIIEGNLDAYSSGGYDNNKQGKGIDCLINNNNRNTNTNIGGSSGNQTIPPVPPEQRATLNVTKTVTCTGENIGGPSCRGVLADITENIFSIQVFGSNPDPSAPFPGSETGTTVTLGVGAYTVTEDPDETSIEANLGALGGIIGDNIIGPVPSFTGDCTQAGTGSFSATGNITSGESQTCNIFNQFIITNGGGITGGSSIIAQDTQDSSGLTALEKIEKLKKQWLELLP